MTPGEIAAIASGGAALIAAGAWLRPVLVALFNRKQNHSNGYATKLADKAVDRWDSLAAENDNLNAMLRRMRDRDHLQNNWIFRLQIQVRSLGAEPVGEVE